jgi:hypothetical protein
VLGSGDADPHLLNLEIAWRMFLGCDRLILGQKFPISVIYET